MVSLDPFNKSSADVILVSSDNDEFRVHKIILSEASTFFETMFSLPQPTQAFGPGEQGTNDTNPEGLPVIHTTETSSILDSLLRLCYPIRDPVLTDLTVVRGILEAAAKYDMDEAKELMRGRLIALASVEPLRVYAIACLYALEDVASAAAKEVLQQNLETSYVEEMEEITAGEYNRLTYYCFRKGRGTKPYSFCRSVPPPVASEDPKESAPSDAPHPFNMLTADAILRSSDSVNFRVHRTILAMASPVLEEKLGQSRLFAGGGLDGPDEINAGQACLPIIYLPEHSRTISTLLRLYYPFDDPELDVIQDCLTAVMAAKKYGMRKAVRSLEKQVMSIVDMKSDPLQAYLIAARLGMREQAVSAAKYTLECRIKPYQTVMEDISAGPYYRLQQYRRRCADAARNIANNWASDCAYSDFCIMAGVDCWVATSRTEFVAILAINPVGSAVLSNMAAAVEKVVNSGCGGCRGSQGMVARLTAYVTVARAVDEAVSQIDLEWKHKTHH